MFKEARALFYKGLLDEAAPLYEALLAAEPAHVERTGRPGEAVGCFRQALDVDTDYLEARLGLGQALRRLERDDDAMVAYRAVLEAEPGHIAAQYGLATNLTRRHRDEEPAAYGIDTKLPGSVIGQLIYPLRDPADAAVEVKPAE